jgi:hypothetical protein
MGFRRWVDRAANMAGFAGGYYYKWSMELNRLLPGLARSIAIIIDSAGKTELLGILLDPNIEIAELDINECQIIGQNMMQSGPATTFAPTLRLGPSNAGPCYNSSD